MQTFGDLVKAARDRPGTALDAPLRSYDYRNFQATVYKTGNLLRHQGVSESSTVAVLDRRDTAAVLCLLGAGLLGAATRFDPDGPIDDRVLFGPTAALGEYETAARTRQIGYGSPPENPAWVHFERDMWSENPAFPETPVDPASAALVADGSRYSHATLLGAASRVVDDLGLDSEDTVAIRATFANPGTVVAGVLAPLHVGATILLPDADAVGTVAVADEDAPEDRVIETGSVGL